MLGLYISQFVEFLRSEEGRSWLESAAEKKSLFGKLLSQVHIDALTDEELRQLFENVECMPKHQAAQLVKKIMEKYGLDSVKEYLKYFLYGADPLEDRFDRVRLGLPELPMTILTEIATYARPMDFCIWDEGAKVTVRFIGYSRMHNLTERAFREDMEGIDYVACKVTLNHLREHIRGYAQRKADFIDTFLFTRYMSEVVIPTLLGDVQAKA